MTRTTDIVDFDLLLCIWDLEILQDYFDARSPA